MVSPAVWPADLRANNSAEENKMTATKDIPTAKRELAVETALRNAKECCERAKTLAACWEKIGRTTDVNALIMIALAAAAWILVLVYR